MDQNQAVAQIADYAAYLDGAHQGKGPLCLNPHFEQPM